MAQRWDRLGEDTFLLLCEIGRGVAHPYPCPHPYYNQAYLFPRTVTKLRYPREGYWRVEGWGEVRHRL